MGYNRNRNTSSSPKMSDFFDFHIDDNEPRDMDQYMTCDSPDSSGISSKPTNMLNKSAITSPISINQSPKIFKKSKWTPEEDCLLKESIQKNGMSNWSLVAQMIPGRSGKQCRERWINQLCPNLSKDNWSANEDAILIQQQRLYGNVWSKIAQFLPGRSSNNVKNRWSWLSRHRVSPALAAQMMPYAIQQQRVQHPLHNAVPRSTATPDLLSPQQTAPDMTWNFASDGSQLPQLPNRFAFSEPSALMSDITSCSSMISTESDSMMIDEMAFGLPHESDNFEADSEIFEPFDWN